MLEQFYTLPAVLRRHRARLLGPHLDTFVAGSSDLGYVRETVRHQCDIVGCFSDWLERRGLEVADIDRSVIDRHVCWRGRTGRAAERVTLLRFFEHMQTRGVIQRPSPGPRPSRVEALIARFEKHLTLQRRVLPTTAAGYAAFAQEFLSASHQDGGPRLRNLRASDVSKFVVTWTRTRPRGRARLLVTALRSFCRFLLQNGEIDADLAAAVPSVAGWRLAGLPRHLPPEQVERILECCDRNTTKGRRDYAVIMLLARLGVRACEVVRLELDDVDGHAGELIVRGKGHREDRLPLVPEVGQALADYLRNGRPVCATRRVFVRTRAPIRGIGVQGVETIVCRAMERASLDPPSKGAHTLRHSLATRLLAVTGLRISEAIGLDDQDVDWAEGVLTIRQTKFKKSRMVPVHPSTARALRRYRRRRNRLRPLRSTDGFFVSERGHRLTDCTARWTFNKLSRETGVRGQADRRGPRLHDFRHRLAVKALVQWYRQGADVEGRLPVLSTYLGHAHVTDTYWYLTAVPELLRLAADRLEARGGSQS